MNPATLLARLHACASAQNWAKDQPDPQTAWENCGRSDWMLWVLARATIDQNDPRLRLMACDFAEAVLHFVPEGEERPRKVIEIARQFATGAATWEEMSAAGDAAEDAIGDATSSSTRAAARAAAWVATWAAIRAAARAATWAAAVDAGWEANWDETTYDDWADAWATQATIIRRYFPECPEISVENLEVAS